MSKYMWDDAPNRQQAIETTIPTLSGLMMGLLGALFVAAAITDVPMMQNAVAVRTVPWNSIDAFQLPYSRSFWVCLSAAASGLCFYLSIKKCIWAQMQVFRVESPAPPDVVLLGPDATEDDKRHWLLQTQSWEDGRKRDAKRGLLLFNLGALIVFLPFVFLLPPQLIGPGMVAFLAIFIMFIVKIIRDRKLERMFG